MTKYENTPSSTHWLHRPRRFDLRSKHALEESQQQIINIRIIVSSKHVQNIEKGYIKKTFDEMSSSTHQLDFLESIEPT